MRYFLFVGIAFFIGLGCAKAQQASLSLNGIWEIGDNRHYTAKGEVPGIVRDPSKPNEGNLWYRRSVSLPQGKWSEATLELRGARFRPEVYVDGQKVSSAEGGMAPTFHQLASKQVKPGATIELEIALESLDAVPPEDASYIPPADQWRSNRSSCLWDDVILHFHYGCRIDKIILFPNVTEKTLRIDYSANPINSKSTIEGTGVLFVKNQTGEELIRKSFDYKKGRNSILLSYRDILEEWSPESPNLYSLELLLDSKDRRVMSFGIKEFSTKNKQFFLNGKPFTLRGSTVVWHRWVRDSQSRKIAYDTTWFRDNIVLRLKEHGANLLRFHLGVPPRRLLDLCDRYGLAVQYEWSFFHGMPASEESCREQYGRWLSAAVEHPSICIYHPYNETQGDELQRIWNALDANLKEYPPLILSERDVIHLHKYWWSAFENVGLFYDHYEQFSKPIMVDEFGGNYIDGEGELGGYVTLKESSLRFLGREQTPQMRMKLQEYSHGRIAEYWRRVGAAGIAPFPIASSWEDGNHWFSNNIRRGNPKPVWNSLTPAWSPVSVSAEIWDRNFTPGQTISFPLWFFNETEHEEKMRVQIRLEDTFGKIYWEQLVEKILPAYSRQHQSCSVTMPDRIGDFILKAELLDRPKGVKYPIVSKWDVKTFIPHIPDVATSKTIYIPEDEIELLAFASDRQLKVSDQPETSDLLLCSRITWEKIAAGDHSLREMIRRAIQTGKSVVLLDVGDIALGQGYPEEGEDTLGPLQSVVQVDNPKVREYELFSGIKLIFTEAAEPESFMFPAPNDDRLWQYLPRKQTDMWNGYRGGLISPAYDMSIHGLNTHAVLEQWSSRGADKERMSGQGDYYAFELYGFYAFTNDKNDMKTKNELKERVRFLIEDAPALAVVMNPDAPVTVTDLIQEYQNSRSGVAESMEILGNAGKNLTKAPVLMVNFGEGKGRIIVSQLLTQGRLHEGFGSKGLYGVRYDPTAEQLVLNMLDIVLNR